MVVQNLGVKDKPKRKTFAEIMHKNYDTRTCPLHNLLITDEALFYFPDYASH